MKKTLERLLGDLHENGHRALVFSQFVDYLAIVRKLLETNGWTCEYLDRVHRIGQRLPVTVYRLIAQNTIEEKVVNLHAKKTALAEDVLSSGASSLSAKAMLDLLSEDTQRE